MASLSIGNATYGRDSSGKSKLKADLDSQMEKLISELKGSNYSTMINTINKYWTGADADDFKNDLKKQIESVQSDVKQIKKYMDQAIDQDYTNFTKFQARNVK